MACKNINSTSADGSDRNLPFNNSIYMTISHQEDQSLLRRKLMNLALAERLSKTKEVTEDSKIKNGDEFQLLGDKFNSSILNVEEYNYFKSNTAEVIISYPDRLDIYFVPTGIQREKAFMQLGLKNDGKLSWVGADTILVKDKVYYLLSASKRHLLENDVHFNQQKMSLGESFNEKNLTFSSTQVLELDIAVDYFQPETTYTLKYGAVANCKNDMREAGMCGSCNYQMETLTGRFIQAPMNNAELVDLDVFINGKKYALKELNPKLKNGHFLVDLNLKQLSEEEKISIHIQQNTQMPISKSIQAVGMTQYCINRNVTGSIDVTPSVRMNVEINVKGRELTL